MLSNFNDVDAMENFWTHSIIESLDSVATWKISRLKQKRYYFPNEVKSAIQRRNYLEKLHKVTVNSGTEDLELTKQFKKQRNYCKKLIKNAVKGNTGRNITSDSSVKDIWKSINDILKPNSLVKTSIKIQTEDKLIEDPLELAEKFNIFFKESG